MKYVVIIEKSANGFGAYVPDLPGCAVVAETREEALELLHARGNRVPYCEPP